MKSLVDGIAIGVVVVLIVVVCLFAGAMVLGSAYAWHQALQIDALKTWFYTVLCALGIFLYNLLKLYNERNKK